MLYPLSYERWCVARFTTLRAHVVPAAGGGLHGWDGNGVGLRRGVRVVRRLAFGVEVFQEPCAARG
jgi:hypothetical protein